MTLANNNGIYSSDLTSFWVVCCEETAAAQALSKTISEWEIPGVRSLMGTQALIQSDIKQADYAIFAMESDRPCSQVQVSPLSLSHTPHLAKLLASMQSPHGRKPQSWVLELPKEEVRANRVQPVNPQYAVDQALSRIEVFVRNYHLKPRACQAAVRVAN